MGVYVVILRYQYFSFIDSIFRALSKIAHALWNRSSVTWKIALLFAKKWVGMGNSQQSVFNWQYGNHIEDICHDLINLDKDESTGSSEVDEVEIMDNILQQSGNVQVDDNDDDADNVNIEYISTTSVAQAICNICNFLWMCPLVVHQVFYLQKSDILENLEEQP